MDGGLPPVCILAGGLGTRLGDAVREIAKPLLHVAGEPFLIHQLRLLARHGADRALICVGYLGEQVEHTIGAERFGISITYSYDGPVLIGTLGAVRKAASKLGPRFLVLYGDTYLRLDYAAFADEWRASGCPGAMAVLRNAGRWERSNAEYRHGRVTRYDKFAPTDDMAWIDYGLGGLDAEAAVLLPESVSDLAVLYNLLADRGELFGFPATRRFYDIGTPEALRKTERFLSAPRGV
jgi:NDP-sugar pyrophosphorylase family protein